MRLGLPVGQVTCWHWRPTQVPPSGSRPPSPPSPPSPPPPPPSPPSPLPGVVQVPFGPQTSPGLQSELLEQGFPPHWQAAHAMVSEHNTTVPKPNRIGSSPSLDARETRR